METILIGLDDPLLFKLLPSILIIIGFGITIWRIRAEANSQKALIEGQNKWEQDEKLRDQQEKYLEDFLVLMEEITDATVIDKNLFIKLQSFTFKSIHLFDDRTLNDSLLEAINIINENKLTSVTTGDPVSEEINTAIEDLNNALGTYLQLLIIFFQNNR